MSVPVCRVLFQHEVGFKTSKPESKAWKESSYNEEVLHPPVHSLGTRSSQEGRLDGYGATRGVIASFGAGVGGVGSRRV